MNGATFFNWCVVSAHSTSRANWRARTGIRFTCVPATMTNHPPPGPQARPPAFPLEARMRVAPSGRFFSRPSLHLRKDRGLRRAGDENIAPVPPPAEGPRHPQRRRRLVTGTHLRRTPKQTTPRSRAALAHEPRTVQASPGQLICIPKIHARAFPRRHMSRKSSGTRTTARIHRLASVICRSSFFRSRISSRSRAASSNCSCSAAVCIWSLS